MIQKVIIANTFWEIFMAQIDYISNWICGVFIGNSKVLDWNEKQWFIMS